MSNPMITDEFYLLSSVLELKPRGDEFVALCPFHHETDPSFYVNFERRLFYCFGCHMGGTLDTLFRLLKLKPETDRKDSPSIYSIYEVLNTAQKFFREQLRLNPHAFESLKRKNRERFETLFGLGYAPSDPTALLNHLRSLGFTDELLVKSGLFSEKLYPILTNRITIPITDLNGRIVAFAGRALTDDVKSKYINTRNSPIFRKQAILYLAHKAAFLLEKMPVPILYVVEGFFDAMAFIASGMPAVAVMGAVATAEQLRLISKLIADSLIKKHSSERKELDKYEIRLLFDADEAGFTNAIKTAAQMLSFKLSSIKIGILPSGCDPEDIVSQLHSVKMYSPLVAIAVLIAKVKPHPEKAAKLLLELPSRKQVFTVLSKMSVSKTYINLLSEFLRKQIRQETQRTVLRLSVDELIVAAVLQNKLNVLQLPDEFVDTLIIHNKNLYEIVTALKENKPIPQSAEALAAKLAFVYIPVLNEEELVIAALYLGIKRKALSILQAAVSNPSDQSLLERLQAEFREANELIAALQQRNVEDTLSIM